MTRSGELNARNPIFPRVGFRDKYDSCYAAVS